jgi:hypothetical protein
MIYCGECVHFLVNPTTAEPADGRCLAPIPAAIIKPDRYTVAVITLLECPTAKKRSEQWNYGDTKMVPR